MVENLRKKAMNRKKKLTLINGNTVMGVRLDRHVKKQLATETTAAMK